MFNSQIIDVALGLIFTYFFLSVVLSAANEWIAKKQNWRPQMLYEGLLVLLGGNKQKELLDKIYDHPLFLGNAPGKTDYAPSYIPARSFALALMDSLKEGDGKHMADDVSEVLKKKDSDNPLRKALLPLVEIADGDLEKVLKNIETWYQGAQDRIIGWYKRKSKKYIFWLALVLCVLLNADTFRIAKAFYSDQALRAGVVAAVEKQTAKPMPAEPEAKEKWERETIETAKQLNLPLGWCDELPWLTENLPTLCGKRATSSATGGRMAGAQLSLDFWPSCLWLLFKVLGIIFTAAALTMGAPFWFDLLNKVVNLRNAGKRPEGGRLGEPGKEKYATP